MIDQCETKRKYTKAEVGYKKSDDPCQHRCGICEYHEHTPDHKTMLCSVVEGEIKPNDGCKLFSIDLIEAALHPWPKK